MRSGGDRCVLECSETEGFSFLAGSSHICKGWEGGAEEGFGGREEANDGKWYFVF